MSQSGPGSKRRKVSKITSFFKKREAGEDSPDENAAGSPTESSTASRPVEEPSTSKAGSDQHDQNVAKPADPLHLSYKKPNQPAVDTIRPKEKKNQKVYFQSKWFKTYPWLHYDEEKGGVLCFECSRAEANGILNLIKVKEPTFIDSGFSNWKKATQRFESHQSSECHRFAAL